MYDAASPVFVLSPWPRWSYGDDTAIARELRRDVDEVHRGAGVAVQQEEWRISRSELVVAEHDVPDFDLLAFRHFHGVLPGSAATLCVSLGRRIADRAAMPA